MQIPLYNKKNNLEGLHYTEGNTSACNAGIPYRLPVHTLAALLPIQLLANGMGKAGEDGPRAWTLLPTWAVRKQLRLQSGTAMVMTAIQGINQPMEPLRLSLPNFQINEQIFKKQRKRRDSKIEGARWTSS